VHAAGEVGDWIEAFDIGRERICKRAGLEVDVRPIGERGRIFGGVSGPADCADQLAGGHTLARLDKHAR
jgi:hypothetical protein